MNGKIEKIDGSDDEYLEWVAVGEKETTTVEIVKTLFDESQRLLTVAHEAWSEDWVRVTKSPTFVASATPVDDDDLPF